MSVNPNQDPNQSNQYSGGYAGYTPSSSADDPYGAFNSQAQPGSGYQQTGTGYQQSQQSSSGQQQQQFYQPPLSAQSRSGSSSNTGSADPTSTGLNARNEAVLSYLFWWLSGLVFLVIERKNRFVRFHAAQSFIFLGGVFVLYVILRLITIIPLIGFLLNPIVSCAVFVLLVPAGLIWLFLMIQSYRGVTVRLPVVADYADALLARFSGRKRTA